MLQKQWTSKNQRTDRCLSGGDGISDCCLYGVIAVHMDNLGEFTRLNASCSSNVHPSLYFWSLFSDQRYFQPRIEQHPLHWMSINWYRPVDNLSSTDNDRFERQWPLYPRRCVVVSVDGGFEQVSWLLNGHVSLPDNNGAARYVKPTYRWGLRYFIELENPHFAQQYLGVLWSSRY